MNELQKLFNVMVGEYVDIYAYKSVAGSRLEMGTRRQTLYTRTHTHYITYTTKEL